MGKLSYKDIKQFSSFSGIEKLYPKLNDSMIVDILNPQVNSAMEIKGHRYEDLGKKVDFFNELAVAILKNKIISFIYKEKQREVKPYKLINTNGIWYLLGVEGDVVKHFALSKIKSFNITDEEFVLDKSVLETLKQKDSTWVSQNLIEVILEVDVSMAAFFLRRDLLPNQKIVEHTKESLILSAQVAYEEEIFQIVRYWIPHMKITSPSDLQEKLEKSLKNYLNL